MNNKINILLLNKLPNEIVNYIIFLSRPTLSIRMKKEIELEAAHMMCKIHYEWWYPKFVRYWHLNDIEDITELPLEYTYDYTLLQRNTTERIKFIMTQLFNCGCCKRHSQGILDKPHCKHLRKKFSLREIRDVKTYGYSLKCMFPEIRHNKNNECNCICRHVLRNIYRNIKNVN